jgi:undecaprenyl pyrophosphate phosphatase UppP
MDKLVKIVIIVIIYGAVCKFFEDVINSHFESIWVKALLGVVIGLPLMFFFLNRINKD